MKKNVNIRIDDVIKHIIFLDNVKKNQNKHYQIVITAINARYSSLQYPGRKSHFIKRYRGNTFEFFDDWYDAKEFTEKFRHYNLPFYGRHYYGAYRVSFKETYSTIWVRMRMKMESVRMEPEEIKLGECASCHKLKEVHTFYMSYCTYAFICNECENKWLKSLKEFKINE